MPTGDIFWEIHRAATAMHADLIVVGDHRRSPLRDLIRDTTAERLIRISALPVLIARIPGAPSYRHAVVGVESEEGTELIETLAGLGEAAPAAATVLHAISTPAEGLMYYAGVERKARDDYRARIAQEARSRLKSAVRKASIPTDVRISELPPATAISELVQSEKSDLVVVSSHARRAATRGILGSVSSELIRHGTTDLLVVPRIVSSRQHT